jgi:adenine-specific DNA methylase
MTENWYRFSYLDCSLRGATPNGRGSSVTEDAFVAPVSAGKSARVYNAHSYPTKVPPEAIEPFLLHYTKPGDVVLDPFSGSGMTGVAARRLGRRAVLNDLAPLAMHLAYNHTTPCSASELQRTWKSIRSRLTPEVERLYGISCSECGTAGMVRYTIWSDVYGCPGCATEVPLWTHGVDRERGSVGRKLTCPHCRHSWQRSAAERVRVEPAWVAYRCGCSARLTERALTNEERETVSSFRPWREDLFVPRAKFASDREMYKRSALHLHGISTLSDFYTPRNLVGLALLWDAIREVKNERVRLALAFAFTNTAWHGTRMRRFNARGGHRPLTGTLYIPQLSAEANVFDVFHNKISHLARFYAEMGSGTEAPPVGLHRGSATNLAWLADASVDYIFTDPPFGSNIFYADCNLIAEGWLGTLTDPTLEAVVNRSRTPEEGGKTLDLYGGLMEQAFSEMHRVLKPDHWATVVFQSSDGEVWMAIEEAAAQAGFEVHDASVLDKVQQSMKGYKGRSGAENVASFDIVLNLRKRQGTGHRTLTILSAKSLEEHVRSVVEARLADLPEGARVERSLPYLYSLAVQSLLNAGYSVRGLTMDRLRRTLSLSLVEKGGSWYL